MRSCLTPRGFGGREVEGGAPVHDALCPDSAPVTGDDTLHGGEPDSGALEHFGAVEPLEHAEQLRYVPHIEPDAIVPHEDDDLLLIAVGAADLDLGLRARARELDGVGEEIDEDEPQHRAVAEQG